MESISYKSNQLRIHSYKPVHLGNCTILSMMFIWDNEDALRKDSLLCKHDKAFGKEIKMNNNSNLSLTNVTDSVTLSHKIVNMWNSLWESG